MQQLCTQILFTVWRGPMRFIDLILLDKFRSHRTQLVVIHLFPGENQPISFQKFRSHDIGSAPPWLHICVGSSAVKLVSPNWNIVRHTVPFFKWIQCKWEPEKLDGKGRPTPTLILRGCKSRTLVGWLRAHANHHQPVRGSIGQGIHSSCSFPHTENQNTGATISCPCLIWSSVSY